MDHGRYQGYVASLEQMARNTHLNLREAMEQFQELCHRVSPGRIVPLAIITDIREIYKEIQTQLKKISGIHHLLEGKYKHYYRRDAQREKEILEFAFLSKTLYSKFEYTLMEIEAKRTLREKGKRFEMSCLSPPLAWFHYEENQVVLLRTLADLYKLDYPIRSDLRSNQKREVTQTGLRSVSLFALSGKEAWIDHLQSRMRLREYDMKERLAKGELRGALTHLREISRSEVEQVIRRFTQGDGCSKLKCLLFPIQTEKDLEKELLCRTENIFQEMVEGEIRTFSI
ncbi:MAG: hypothetical protein HXY44_16710 [Syntrophaceae bacterium]|nr:hypothetical protein [Syntrophaceae bacterium]